MDQITPNGSSQGNKDDLDEILLSEPDDDNVLLSRGHVIFSNRSFIVNPDTAFVSPQKRMRSSSLGHSDIGRQLSLMRANDLDSKNMQEQEFKMIFSKANKFSRAQKEKIQE